MKEKYKQQSVGPCHGLARSVPSRQTPLNEANRERAEKQTMSCGYQQDVAVDDNTSTRHSRADRHIDTEGFRLSDSAMKEKYK